MNLDQPTQVELDLFQGLLENGQMIIDAIDDALHHYPSVLADQATNPILDTIARLSSSPQWGEITTQQLEGIVALSGAYVGLMSSLGPIMKVMPELADSLLIATNALALQELITRHERERRLTA